jgi:prophage tail gpP-like protein
MDRLSPIDTNNRVSLEVGGARYEGWKQARIRHSIDQLAGTFSLAVHDRWPEQTDSWAIEPGNAAVVKIGSDVVITGYADVVKVSVSPHKHDITVEGRDKTGDLVDCSAPAREWAGQNFEHIADELCTPFGIEVLTQLETGASGYKAKKAGKVKPKATKSGGGQLPRKASNSGETVHKLLEKLAKIQGALLISNGTGGLVVTRAGLNGRATDMLVMNTREAGGTDGNVMSVDYERSFANLFSEITVKGQAHGAGFAQLSAVQSVKPKATVMRGKDASVVNASVGRYRPLTLVAEDQADAARCQKRAQWEAGTREAKSKKLTVRVQGWRQSDGSLWMINTLTRMRAPFVREDEDLLIAAVEFVIDLKEGTYAQLTLLLPKAFDVLPEIPKPATGAGVRRLSGVGR